MIKMNVNLGDRGYPIYVATDFSGLAKAFAASRMSGRIIVITDSNVKGHYLEECVSNLASEGFEVSDYVFEAGEKSKDLETVRGIYKYLSSLKADRSSTLLALGGGVVGDITGFAAATYLRGINFVQVPTSLLAQADSSIGGKVGVDFEGAKNMIGAFYQPRFVYINVNTLRTLPARELKSGMAEVIKHGLIMDPEFYEYLDYNIRKIYSFDVDVLQYLTKMNCTIKGSVVEKDEKESDLRAILNFGHTMGHAIESESNFELLHGECVSIGMSGAYRLALKLGMVEKSIVDRVEGTLVKAGLPIRAHGFDADRVYQKMFMDKKTKGGRLTFVLPRGIGEVIRLSLNEEELIKGVLAELFE